MNILIIAQCRKNALIETRRILDQFLERRGERTWQGPMTADGLETVYRLLRRTARKNTAVACHWIHGQNNSELLWVVGNLREFNSRGQVPTDTTGHDILRSQDENDWHSATDIRLLAQLAALFHDFGKGNTTFQKKLTASTPQADPLRHEWISLRLFEAFVNGASDDRSWLERLVALAESSAPLSVECLARTVQDGALKSGQKAYSPFRALKTPLARAVGWLIVSHHRMPVQPPDWKINLGWKCLDAVRDDWCGSRLEARATDGQTASASDKKAQQALLKGCWEFKLGLSLDSQHWRTHAARVARAALQRPGMAGGEAAQVLQSPYVLHLARLSLMLADHYYSAQPSHTCYGDKPGARKKPLYANSSRNEAGEPVLKQRLDEHLIGVEVNAARIMRTLPRLADSLPRIARHRSFRERSQGAFAWQNKAFDLAESLREPSQAQGFFGINLASTGCGKTLGNARILYGLADPVRGARFSIALGLRTLTLQTGDALRSRLKLAETDLAVLVGGGPVRGLYAHHQQLKDGGSESAADLIPEHSYVRYEGSLEEGPLKHWLYPGTQAARQEAAQAEGSSDEADAGLRNTRREGRQAQATALLDAPVLVCTVDHLMPATESGRGGHQILPMLRLMSADLVLDEIDDFGLEDMYALTRLVHWAGLLGSRVLLSSATLPPALVQGLFLAYCAGREEFQRHRGQPGTPLQVCCGWFDEFGAESAACSHADSAADFLAAHQQFVDKRIARLAASQDVRRQARIVPLEIAQAPKGPPALGRRKVCEALAGHLQPLMGQLHQQHASLDPVSGKRVSFGLIRMANIEPLVDAGQALWRLGAPADTRIHLCVYHAQHPLVVRSALERTLDTCLKRHGPDAVFQLPEIRARLDASPETHHLFVVLATAVAEVGRDHDYDWAIVEPSSMRSIIQLAGRVRRHRPGNCPPDQPNIYLLETNVAHLRYGLGKPAFRRPGFEGDAPFNLTSHHLGALLSEDQWLIIDARARLRPRAVLQPNHNLVDLEHFRLQDLMVSPQTGQNVQASVNWWWQAPEAHLTAALQKEKPFRKDDRGQLCYLLRPNEEGEAFDFYLTSHKHPQPVLQNGQFTRLGDAELPPGPRIQAWAVPPYLEALEALGESFPLDLDTLATRFGSLNLPGRADQPQAWRYHPVFGVTR